MVNTGCAAPLRLSGSGGFGLIFVPNAAAMLRVVILPAVLFISSCLSAQTKAVEWYNKGLEEKKARNVKAALVAFTRAYGLDKEYAEAWCQAGWCQVDLKAYETAIPLLEKAIQLKPDYLLAYRELGYALKKLERYLAAVQKLEEGILRLPGEAALYKDLGDIYRINLTLPDKALETYNRGLAVNPLHAGCNFGIGFVLNERHAYRDAIPYLTNAIGQGSNDKQYFSELGYAYFRLNENDRALEFFEKAQKLDSNAASVYRYLGDLYRLNYKPARAAEAQTYYQKALQKDAGDIPSLYGMAWCLMTQEKFDEAVTAYQYLLRLYPNYAACNADLGFIYMRQGRYKEAAALLDRATEASPAEKMPFYHAALCQLELKNTNRARYYAEQLEPLDAALAKELQEKIRKF